MKKYLVNTSLLLISLMMISCGNKSNDESKNPKSNPFYYVMGSYVDKAQGLEIKFENDKKKIEDKSSIYAKFTGFGLSETIKLDPNVTTYQDYEDNDKEYIFYAYPIEGKGNLHLGINKKENKKFSQYLKDNKDKAIADFYQMKKLKITYVPIGKEGENGKDLPSFFAKANLLYNLEGKTGDTPDQDNEKKEEEITKDKKEETKEAEITKDKKEETTKGPEIKKA